MASIICKYLDGTTKICNNEVDISEIFSDIKVNGNSIGVKSNYSVSSIDEVEFITKSNFYLYDYAFYNCTGLKSVSIGEGLWGIYDFVFEGCKNLETIVLPSSLKTIGEGAFLECESLRDVNLPEMVNDIGERAFGNCYSITSITIPNRVDLLRNHTFIRCSSLSTINFGSGLQRIEQYVFDDCTSLKKVTIPDSVTYINLGAFNGCTSLEKVYFGNGIEKIDYDVFSQCSSLNKIYVTKSELPETSEYTFRNIARGGTLYYPTGSDYSQWLSTDPYYLGYYGWNGVQMNVEDIPEISIDPESFHFGIDVNGSNFIIDVTTNAEITTDRPVDWCYVWTEDKYKNKRYFLNCYDNGGAARSTRIEFKATLGELSESAFLTITQDGISVDPDEPDNPDAPSVGSETRTIVFEASGGTQPVNFTWSNVSYDDISTKAEAADSWVELDYEGLVSPTPTITQYLVTAGVNNGDPRTTYLTFTGSTSTGEISTETIKIYQKNNNGDLPNDSDMSTGCYINLDSYEHTFPATGGTFSVMAYFGFPTTSGLKTRVYSGAVYPILWCTAENVGGGVEDDGTEANEIWEITMTNNNFDETRTATITFSYTNFYGESTSVVFTAKQEAGAGEDKTIPKVSATNTVFNVNSDGTPEYASYTYIGGLYQAVTIHTPIVSGDWIHLGTGTKYNGVIYGYDTRYDYPISFDANTGDTRTGKVTFSGTDLSGNTLTCVCNITQTGANDEPDEPEVDPDAPEDSDETTFAPIWQDTEYQFASDAIYGLYTESYYRLPGNAGMQTVDNLIFKGRAYAAPDEWIVKVNINKICQNYMGEHPDIFDGAVGYDHSFQKFKLKDEYGNLLHTYYFVGDWSYEDLKLGIKTDPITPYMGTGQMLFFSTLAQAQKGVKWGMRYNDGTPAYDNTEYVTNSLSTVVVPESRRKNVEMFYFGDKSYSVLPKCKCKYVIYYMNPYGGFDWFAVTGRVNRKDELQTYSISQNYNNTTTRFGNKRYLSTILVNYEVNTQWLTEEQSNRMWELIESNCVWIHNLETDEIIPVVITNTEVEHQQKTISKRMLSYTINLQHSQTRERF